MANPEHLAKLKEGVEAWNQWREENPDIRPSLDHTNFRLVDLSGANLSDADICHTNFDQVNLSGANLSGAFIKSTEIIHCLLLDANLSSAYLYKASLLSDFSGVDFSDSDLCDADFIGGVFSKAIFSGANLESAKLNSATFTKANLSNTNLRRCQALGTNFNNSTLTGFCIEDWHIDNQTNFQNVTCDYIYLKHSLSVFPEEVKWIFTDRVPHDPDKIFAPGEFTKRYQKILETVNLYFEDSIDWQAFLVSFNKLQIECNSDELSINSFENKGNGSFVIKVNVSDGADKAEIEKYLKKQYQLEATVEAQKRELTNLYEITKLLAGRPINVNNQASGNTYNQNGNIGIGHNQGNISDNSQVSGVNNEPRQQDRNQ